MDSFKVGDIVGRKSYGGDISFVITRVIHAEDRKPIYVLKGMLYRIEADSSGDDLVKHDYRSVYRASQQQIYKAKRQCNRSTMGIFSRLRTRPGKILHIDSSEEFLEKCLKFYREANLRPVGYLASESEQPDKVRPLLERHRPDILVTTGHDGLKKNTGSINSIDNYRNSKYFIASVEAAREYEPDMNKLCVFSGACQSYYEAIMKAGANFASSPGRILINALDPAIVSEKIATTDSKRIVTPGEIAQLTISGPQGIGGVNTRGHLVWN